MALIKWSEQFSVGIPQIDAQHQQLVSLLNELYDAMSAGQAQDALGAILARLVGYTKKHFADEEAWMARATFPFLRSHKAAHRELTDQVAEFHRKFTSGATAINVQLTSFLKKWLQEHILQVDKRYAPFCAKVAN